MLHVTNVSSPPLRRNSSEGGRERVGKDPEKPSKFLLSLVRPTGRGFDNRVESMYNIFYVININGVTSSRRSKTL